MDFCWVTLHVNDMEASLHFYHDLLDLPVASRFTSGEFIEIAMLGSDNLPKVELLSNKYDKGEKHGDGISIGFQVASLDEAVTHLKNNAVLVTKGPFAPTPKMRFCYVNDPDGFEVQLVENS